jgi:hypothetical protein
MYLSYKRSIYDADTTSQRFCDSASKSHSTSPAFLVAVVIVVLFYYVTTWHTPVDSAVLLPGHSPPAVAVE